MPDIMKSDPGIVNQKFTAQTLSYRRRPGSISAMDAGFRRYDERLENDTNF